MKTLNIIIAGAGGIKLKGWFDSYGMELTWDSKSFIGTAFKSCESGYLDRKQEQLNPVLSNPFCLRRRLDPGNDSHLQGRYHSRLSTGAAKPKNAGFKQRF
jgi:hypothetical protein